MNSQLILGFSFEPPPRLPNNGAGKANAGGKYDALYEIVDALQVDGEAVVIELTDKDSRDNVQILALNYARRFKTQGWRLKTQVVEEKANSLRLYKVSTDSILAKVTIRTERRKYQAFRDELEKVISDQIPTIRWACQDPRDVANHQREVSAFVEDKGGKLQGWTLKTESKNNALYVWKIRL